MSAQTMWAGLCAALVSSSVTMAAVWPKFAGTPGNTASVIGTPPPNLGEAVVTNSPQLGVKQSSSVAANYGNVYVYANGVTGTLYCLDSANLSVKWAAPVPVDDSYGWGSWATPCVMNSSVVFAADGYLGCWNLDGSLRWQTTMARETVNSSPVIAGNRVLVGCFSYMNLDGGIAAYHLQTGSQLWYTAAIPNSTFSSCTPAVDEAAGRAYAVCSNQVWCVDLATGQIVWQASAPGAGLQLNNVALAQGTLLAVNYDFMFGPTNLFAFSAANGAFLWSAACGMSDVPPAVHGPTVIHSCGDNIVPPAITAFDLSTGTQKWQRAGLGSMYLTPAAAGGIVYAAVGVYSGWSLLTMSNLTALSVTDGSNLWATGTTRGGQAPAIAEDVIYTANDGVVYAYRWPTLNLLTRRFSAGINTAAGGKDKLKFTANIDVNPIQPPLTPTYVRIGDFVVHGNDLSFVPLPNRLYDFKSSTKFSTKGAFINASGKNGVYAGMLPYLPNDGVTQARVPITIMTQEGKYLRGEVDVTLRTKKGRVRASLVKTQ